MSATILITKLQLAILTQFSILHFMQIHLYIYQSMHKNLGAKTFSMLSIMFEYLEYL
jgi:hypothetical protein